MTKTNKRILLNSRPKGWVTNDNFTSDEVAVPDIKSGEILIRNIYMSVDPYMRGRMNDVKSYVPPFQIGEPLQAGMIGEIIASDNPSYKVGDHVTGMLNWEQYSVTNGKGADGSPLRVLPKSNAPLSYHLGILGMPGMTAWVGLKAICEPKAGESVFVTAASGAVGSVVGQIAKNLGCYAVGSAGGAEKCALLTEEYGYDAAIDYKATDNAIAAVREKFPKGIDCHFENTGGPMFEAAILNMAFHGRIALCGMIADYNSTLADMPPGPRGMMTLVGRSVKMQGFIVFNYPEASIEWVKTAAVWLAEGKLKYHESISEGLASAPDAFIGLLNGKNVGKQIVRIADE